MYPTGAIALLILSYLMGSIPFALVIGKWFWHVDVRQHGSGNVGTTNVFRVLGRRAGILVLVCDMAKGFIPAFVAVHVMQYPDWLALLIAVAAMFGHMYSVFLRGGGGKGVATGAGIVLALMWNVFLISLAVFLLVLVVFRMVSLASICASITFSACTILFGYPLAYVVLGLVATVLVIWAHRGNIRRIALRCENKVTFPWNRPRGGAGHTAAGGKSGPSNGATAA
jgi:acyl phosphate:glycerol-3-phosphate acyltransferase